MTASIAVICFPGSNCEYDVVQAVEELGGKGTIVWHTDTLLDGFNGVVIPGGFAHGDHIRPGAIAQFSPAMAAVQRAAADGLPVLGICNGFQVLVEVGLLPGALMRNDGLRFICDNATCEIVSTSSVLTADSRPGESLVLPINHYEGNFTCDETTLARLYENDQVILRYVDNPNGSTGSVAGIRNLAGNVVGLMPHPERAMSELMGSRDGRTLMQCFVDAAAKLAPSVVSAA